METKEYLWWVETIRQNEFRQLLPLHIAMFLSFAISTICFGFYIIVPSAPAEIVTFSSKLYMIGIIGLLFSIVLIFIVKTVTNRRLDIVKQKWEKVGVEIKSLDKELLYFFNLNEKQS